MTPTMIPFAIDVTDQVPVSGKPWSGGVGNSKLVLHTIEAADPWDIGWPRVWSRWESAPHLAMNSDRFPDGDWLYQTLPFDVAAYAIRDNDLEDNRFMYQMEMAGRAMNTADYPDSFYEAIATVADWFVAEMDVPNDWLDFSCAQAGEHSPCRFTKAEMDDYAGFVGHCHVGYGIDKHWDPGKLDTVRVQSFMEDEMSYAKWIEGWVIGLAEDKAKARKEFQRLYDAGILEGNSSTVDYWVGLLDHPMNPEWPGFYARTELSVWGL
jgi:hypothetical protein